MDFFQYPGHGIYVYILGSFYSNRFPYNTFRVFNVRYHFLYFLLCPFIPIPLNPFSSFIPHNLYFPIPLKYSPMIPYKCPDLLNYESCRQMDRPGNNCSDCSNPDPVKQMLQVFVHKWMLALSLFRDMCFSCCALQSWAATKAPWRGI